MEIETMRETTAIRRAGGKIEILDFFDGLAGALPAELQTKLNQLLPQLLDRKEAEGTIYMIYEGKHGVYKTVRTGPSTGVTFHFPTSTKLEEDSKSSDPAVAEKAKRLKAFEALLEDAFYDSPPGRVIVEYDPKGAGPYGVVEAANITSISVLV
jgi:hypothetical protein